MLEVVEIDEISDQQQAQAQQLGLNNPDTVLNPGVTNDARIALRHQSRNERNEQDKTNTEERLIGQCLFDVKIESQQECQQY